MKKHTFLLLSILSLSSVFAQFSKTHYIPPITSTNSTGADIEEQYLYISTPSVTTVHFKIIELGGTTILGTVSRSTPYEYFIGNGPNTQLNMNSNSINTISSSKGYIIEAEEDVIYVTARINAGNGNQAGELVSKGIASLGTRFRIGGFLNTLMQNYSDNHLTFISVLATENNTTVQFSDIHAGAVLINNAGASNTPAPVILNRGQSYVIGVQGPTSANREALIGSLVTSDKPIVVNCGSFAGTNGEMGNQDTGFDQIVSAERTGTEYIFIKSTGTNNVERVLLIADEDNTDFYLNGNTTGTPNFSLNAGQYISMTGTYYNANGNLYVKTNKNIFAYQSVGDNVMPSQANQEMFFVPPLNCKTPKIIDNIPFLEKIGPKIFVGRVTIVTQTGSSLNFLVNETPYSLAALSSLSGISVTGPTSVVGNTNYETYTINGLSGNVSVYSGGQLYLASYGSNGAATFGGFYSGFTFNPEITFNKINVSQSNCIPNVNLTLSTLSGFDTFQWYFNGTAIPNNGVAVSPFGNALDFDGSNDHINLSRTIQDNFTIEFWMKTTQVGNNGPMWYYGMGLVDSEVGGVTNDFGLTLVGNKVAFGVGNPDITIFSTSNVNTGNWVHVAATRNKATGLIQLFINGVLESSTTANTNSLTAPSTICLGRDANGQEYRGVLDEVRIWDVVRPISSISANMGNVLTGTNSGLVNYYKFDQGIANGTNTTVTTLTDSVGTNNSALLNFALTGTTSNWVGGALVGTSNSNLLPLQPGYYYLSASLSACGATDFLNSVVIPVSDCPTNADGDLANDNVDIDLDNDGLSNCTESFGDLPVNLANTSGGAISIGSYSNSYTGTITTSGSSAPAASPFIGNSNGSFISEVPMEKGNSVTYQMNFAQPISLRLEYVTLANPTDLINSNSDFIVKCQINKTITLLNPDNQLLVDTNYDGIFESGVTQFSSFEIRFRVNSIVPLAAGTGTFSFRSSLINSFSFTQTNLSDVVANKATFSIIATCVPKDKDLDGNPDQLDLDSDNDGISDNVELTSQNYIAPSNVDANSNGMDDIYETGIIASDFDLDGIPDYYDLDSDNDGIKDSVETASNTDGTGLANYVDLDSDGDDCSDVIEAGFLDSDNDTILGNSPVSIDTNGLVTSGIGYTTPNANYLIGAPISITSQPTNQITCELQNATFTIVTTPIDGIQWQVSPDGINWTNIIDNATYLGATSNSLQISVVTPLLTLNKYRAVLTKTGNSCGLISAPALLTTYALPVVANNTMVQCDTDLDTISNFNLTVNNNLISSNFNNETFSYYTSFTGADAENPAEMITNPYSFSNSSSPGVMQVWVRVVNSNNCYRVATLTLQVVATNIPSTFTITVPPVCDDFLDINGNNTTNNDDRDGISSFNFAYTKTILEGMLPVGNYSIKYYRNQADAESEFDSAGNSLEISQNSDPAATNTIFNYRNIGYPDAQNIWVRIVSDVNNGCYGLGPYVSLVVEALPFAYSVIIPRECDTDQDGIFNFNTSTLETTLLQGQTNVSVTYFNSDNSPLLDSNSVTITSFPNTFSTTSRIIKAVVTNNSTLGCFDETLIEFIVDKSPVDFTISSDLILECDDEANPLFQDSDYNFMSSSAIHNAIASIQPSGMIIEYYDENNILLSSPLPNPLPVSNSKTIKVVVKNAINPSCKLEKIIEFKVLPTPKIELAHVELICSNIPTFFKTLTAGIQDGSSESDYTYVWAKDGVPIAAAISSTLDVNEEGIYKVKVTNSSGCSHIRTIEVIASEIATLSQPTIVDLIDICTVTINATGLGDYVYALDNINGPYQIGSFFDNVYPGIHQVYVKDSNECGIATQTIAVVGAPHFFTPNGDGINDTWQIQGVNAQFNSNSKIYIFDRYGKLLKQIGTTGLGWDGTFNGDPLPASDYWFSLLLEDGRNLKGHFTLKR